MLEKLRIEQTKSRSRHSNDNALAESKNCSVVRKHFGYSHIPKQHATPINEFLQKTFNPWLNLHRPCMFATQTASLKGKVVKRYANKDVLTPLARLALLLEKGLATLKTGQTLAALQALAMQKTDLEAALDMQREKAVLFARFNEPKGARVAA